MKGIRPVKGSVLLLCALLSLALFTASPPERAQAAPLVTAYKAAVDSNGGTVRPGDTIVYYVVISNLGNSKQANDPSVNEFEDVIPGGCVYLPFSAQVVRGGGSISYLPSENKVTWNGEVEPGVDRSVVLLFSVVLSPTLREGETVENQGLVHWDTDGDGRADRLDPTDDPRTPLVPDDPTRVTIGQSLRSVFAEKVAYDENGGAVLPEDAVRYEVLLVNAGPFPLKAEFLDPIPAHTTYVSGSASATDQEGDPVGTVTFEQARNRVVWSGNIPAVGMVRINFRVLVESGTPGGTTISNQGTLLYDPDGDGNLDATLNTDYPFTEEEGDPTVITVGSSLLQSWYLAEGSTDGGMETWVLVQNPWDRPVHVTLLLHTGQGLRTDEDLTDVLIPARSRSTFLLNSYVKTYDVSTQVICQDGSVICERAMYGPGRQWAHDSIGVTAPASTWYLAEGSTGGDMETWVLVQNPGDSAVRVEVTFQTREGEVAPAQLSDVTVGARSRWTLKVNDYVPNNYDVSTRVRVKGEGGVICERAMYGPGRQWAHDSIGYAPPEGT